MTQKRPKDEKVTSLDNFRRERAKRPVNGRDPEYLKRLEEAKKEFEELEERQRNMKRRAPKMKDN